MAWAQSWTEVGNATELNNAIANGASIRLTDNITLSAYLKIGQNNTQVITIDLNGHTLQRSGLTAADANGHVIEVFGDRPDRFEIEFEIVNALPVFPYAIKNNDFGYYSNGQIIIDGVDDGSVLEIVDMTGRVILRRDAKSCVSTEGMVPGVYVLRLINGEDVKTQKIVVE